MANLLPNFVSKISYIFCALFWYLALETQEYPKSKILDFPILERMKLKKRNDRFQKIMISGFLVQDIMKVYKISYFGDKIWQQICQKSFFLSVTCWTLNLISEVILDQKTYVSVLLIFEPNQLPLQHPVQCYSSTTKNEFQCKSSECSLIKPLKYDNVHYQHLKNIWKCVIFHL